MGASGSSEGRGSWVCCCCCCCCVDGKRRAVEIGDGSLGERLLDESEGAGDEVKNCDVKRGTVVNDAWLLQVEETRWAASDRDARASRGSGKDDDNENQEDEQHGDGRKTAWDLSDEGENEEEEQDAGEEEEDEDEEAFHSMSRVNIDGLSESNKSKTDSDSWRRSERFSSRSTKDSYASVNDRANGSMMFRESLEDNWNARDDNADDDGGEEEEEDEGDPGSDRHD